MTSSHAWGRFTARGGAEIEAEIASLVTRAARRVEEILPPEAYRALVLIGGYGRGEGGVERRDGALGPHNNLDLLLITTLRGTLGRAADRRRLDALLRPLAEEAGVGIDVGVIDALRLRASPCLVMWFDMRFGHKTLAGDPSFVPSLARFRADRIEPSDVRELLVNRGTLLVINNLLLARGARSGDDRRAIVKHIMKAVIGYGDALLFALGAYHVSYAEKQRRMRARRDVPASFRALYDEAIEFRFEPAYDGYLARDLGAFSERVRDELCPIHLLFESRRLGVPDLSWRTYASTALGHAWRAVPRSPREIARAARNLVRSRGDASPPALGARERLALRCDGPRHNLALVFPAVLYAHRDPGQAELARAVLGAPDVSPGALRRAYLERWGAHVDANFAAVVARLALPLGGAAEAA